MSQTSIPKEAIITKPAARGNRRATIRYRCAPATLGKVLTADDLEFQHAWILEMSLTGVGILVNRRIEPGRLIVLAIRCTEGTRRQELSAHAVHCEPAPQGEWYVGCEFVTMLSPDDLDQLL